MAKMTNVLLQNVQILDQQSSHHQETTHVLLVEGRISDIGHHLTDKNAQDFKGCWLTPGWVDMHGHFHDPGTEYKEDLISGAAAACAGGYTSCLVFPNTQPVLSSKSDVVYVIGRSNPLLAWLPAGAMTEDTAGQQLTEMHDLHAAGAVAFTDGLAVLDNKEVLLKALQYTRQFDGLIISRPATSSMHAHAQMHEGKVSTMLGMRGEPAISEALEVAAQLELLRYAGGRLHFTLVSSADALTIIREAKKEDLAVSCDVGVGHLLYTDEDVASFDTLFKVDPPYRTAADRKALIKGVNDGTIDAIVSAHRPHESDSKLQEFDRAAPGINSLQVVFPMLQKVNGLNWERALAALTVGPRRLLKQPPAVIEKGAIIDLALWSPDTHWHWNTVTNLSKSNNHPLWEKELKGRCIQTFKGPAG